MSNKLAGLLTAIFIFATALAASLLASGCGGEVPEPADDSEGFIINPIKPAPALVEWQFDVCLTPDQRAGLIAALQQIHTNELPELTPSVGLSVCSTTDGQERGALFAINTNVTGRSVTVSSLAIRPVQRRYAFAITKNAYNAVAAYVFSPMPKRFDDNGLPATNGRYLLSGWSETSTPQLATLTYTTEALHILDTQTQKTVDLDYWVSTYIDQSGRLATGTFVPQVSPQSSTDPFVQTVINAAFLYKQKTLYPFQPARSTAKALDFASAPSLKGWPLPFDLLTLDAAGGLIASGGETIM